MSQFYIEPGVFFPFSWHFQKYFNGALNELVPPSSEFCSRYGADYDLVFRMSAKRRIESTELRGPSRYPKAKSIEYSIFLPFDQVIATEEWKDRVLSTLFDEVISVLKKMSFDTRKFEMQRRTIIAAIVNDPMMIDQRRVAESGLTV